MEVSEYVQAVEDSQLIHEQWSEDSSTFREGLKILVKRKYWQAIDRLEHLLLQRFFELQKLGMNGTS